MHGDEVVRRSASRRVTTRGLALLRAARAMSRGTLAGATSRGGEDPGRNLKKTLLLLGSISAAVLLAAVLVLLFTGVI